MAGKKVKLLLNKTVENLGIVGDIVKVRPGFARNFLLPHALAENPTPTKIERLKEARSAALAELAHLRQSREDLVGRMTNVAIAIQRSCNDQGILYGSVTQRDIADALQAAGYGVDVRAVRLSGSIRRIGEYHVPIQFEKDLRADVTLKVEPDRQFEEEREEMEIDDEGELVEKKPGRQGREARAGSEEREGRGRRDRREPRDGEERKGRNRRDRREKGASENLPAAGAVEVAAAGKAGRDQKPERSERAGRAGKGPAKD
ncbi:MAG: 50S ribosomal protein L9 [Phycisphaerales bacterium]|nr:50S ribosomal protein L9 [Phycisphaerales bacterium]MCI0630877.1 50S ribosomal protein L9 [Phycisphaerales bacterium]MCI0676180.1 50S ribosomal protein L9 [Phycisphaerales bacterium]